MSTTSGPTPREGYRGRKTTDKRGGHITPENASAKWSGTRRGKLPKPTPEPEGYGAGARRGSPYENFGENHQVPPVITKDSPKANLSNPLKG